MRMLGLKRGFVLSGLKVFLWMTLLAVFVPWNPVMPSLDLDSSWVYGLNQAVAQKLIFGKDIIFTFGPYASIYTQAFHPATDLRMLWGSLYLVFCYALALGLLLQGVEKFKYAVGYLLALILLFGFFMFSRDMLLLSYPLLLGLVVFKILKNSRENFRWNVILMGVLFSASGLLLLIKGSLGIGALLMGFLSILFLLLTPSNRARILGVVSVLSLIISTAIFWCLAAQPLKDLPLFFFREWQIISGYAGGMGIPANPSILNLTYIPFLLGVIFVFDWLLKSLRVMGSVSKSQGTLLSAIFLLAIFAAFLWMGLKAGFVRFDLHFINAEVAVLIGIFFLPLVLLSSPLEEELVRRLSLLPLMVMASLSLVILAFGFSFSTYKNAYEGLLERIKNPEELTQKFNERIKSLKQEVQFPFLSGTTDIYPGDLSYLIVSGYAWSPRPIFQGYSAYLPQLSELNAQHLLGSSAPQNLIFKVEKYGMSPVYADGESWPILLSDYEPRPELKNSDGFIFLKKKLPVNQKPHSVQLLKKNYAYGEAVSLKAFSSDQILFVKIRFHPSWLGKVINLLFKSSQIEGIFTLADGTQRICKIVPGMAEAGFIVSPFIETTSEFLAMYGNKDSIANKRVISIRFVPVSARFLWKSHYQVELESERLK